MDAYDFSLTLEGTDEPSGEIDLGDLAALAGALKQLATRIGRFVADQDGPGRTAEAVERATRLRLTGLREGCTVLAVAYGEHDVLDVHSALEGETAERFWDVVEGIASNKRPGWVTPLIAESAGSLLDALSQAAAQVRIDRADHRSVAWTTAVADRATWSVPQVAEATEDMTVVGRLEAVDLKSGRFRLRDDVGNAIALDVVDDPASTAHLVGSRVLALGPGVRDAGGRLRLGAGTRLSAAPLPTEWSPAHRVDWEASLAGAGPSFDGIEGLTGDDVEQFLAELHQ